MSIASSSGRPVVAIVGRPNVGKSSLVNRILGRREAIVQETPGVTRDRRSFDANWAGRSFEVLDTGGLEPGAEGLDLRIAEQAQIAMAAADLIVLVVDGQIGPTHDDLEVAVTLRGSPTPVMVAVNKVDQPGDVTSVSEFYSLGLGDPLPVSALHGTGSGDLLQALVDRLPDKTGARDDAWASVAIVGRPNVGKSSILNTLLREARSIVDSTPGTTRDPIDSWLELPDKPEQAGGLGRTPEQAGGLGRTPEQAGGLGRTPEQKGRLLRVVDTAGMRREVQIKDPIEYFSWLRSRGTLGRVDVALLVMDSAEGVTGHDQRIAAEILEAGRGCVVALNKWDLVGGQDSDRLRFEQSITRDLRFLDWATVVRTSALTRRGMDKLVPAIEEAVEAHRFRLGTALVNRLIRTAQEERPHPRSSGRAVKILYAVQARVGPPTIILFCNARLETNYVRYLENRVRKEHPFPGTPLRFEIRVKTRD